MPSTYDLIRPVLACSLTFTIFGWAAAKLGFGKKRSANRSARVAEIERLGYKLKRIESPTFRAYLLEAPDGRILDNHGMGYPSTAEAYAAVLLDSRTD